LLTWTPAEAQGPGTYLVTVAVADNGTPSLSATQSFSLTVTEANSAPVLPLQADRMVDELTLLIVTNTATDADLPANILSYTLLAAPSGANIDTNGIITWTPTEAQGPSTNLFVTMVTDNGTPALSATNSFSVIVNEVNSAPVFTAQPDRTITELQSLSLQLSATDSDVPANTLTFSLLSGPAGLSVAADGLLTWTPSEAQGPSTNTIAVKVADNGTPSLSATQSFVLTVIEANSAPVLSAQTNVTINELTLLTVTNTATDADLPANTLSYMLLNAPNGAAIDTNGVITWTPTEAQGPSSNLFVTVVTDNGSPSLSSTNSFSVFVNEVNTAPVLPAQNDRTINELTLLTVANAASDSDLPANTLSYALLNAPSGATIDANGVITWTPTESQGPSINLFVTTVTDSGSPSFSATNSFTVTVNEVNQAPVLASIANQTINELTTLSLQLSASDADVPANTLTFGLSAGPAGMSVSASGALSWTPTEAQGPSTNSVLVYVSDNGNPSLSATQSFSVVVQEVNTAPQLSAISDQIINPAQLLSLTFSATDSDLAANTLTFSLDVAPVGASVSTGGQFSWTPAFEQAGTTNTVTVRVTDNGSPALSATRSFVVIVTATGLRADYFSGTNFDTLALTRNDAQVDFSWSGSPGTGVPADQFSVRWTGQVIPRYSQTYTFSTVSDDGVRLWVNGFLVIDNWTVHLATTNTGTIALTAGQTYPIKLEYFDGTGTAVARLRWTSSSQSLEVVPNSQLVCTGYNNVIANAIYRFTPKIATGKCIEAKNGGTTDGTEAVMDNWNSKAWQKWQPVDVGSGYFKLIPQHALTKVMEINGGFTTNGTKVQISSDTGSSRQRFQFIDVGQGWFEIHPQSALGSVLDVKGGSTANGTSVDLFQDSNMDQQRWRLDRQ
jgi:PA14 domain./Ricin-type beta-trefoil lectin domain.